MLGITFDEKHTFKDFGLKWVESEVENPSPISNYIQIPGSSVQLNINKTKEYGRRNLTFQFEYLGLEEDWRDQHSIFSDYVHGREMKVCLDTDESYYYYGMVTVESKKDNYATCDFTVSVDADPFKYDLTSSIEDWLWNPFDFETGVIRELKDLEINNTAVEILGGNVSTAPVIWVSRIDTPLSFTVAGIRYQLAAGRNRFPQIRVGKEDVILLFAGKGLVSIDYRGRLL